MLFFHTLGDKGLEEITDKKMASYSVVFAASSLESLVLVVEKIGDGAGSVLFKKIKMGRKQTFKAGFYSYKFSGVPREIIEWGEEGYKKRYLKIAIAKEEIFCFVRIVGIKEEKCDYLKLFD